jgi:hypothetical protein
MRDLPKQQDDAGHHAALPYARAASFIEKLRTAEAGPSAKPAFQFLITASAPLSGTGPRNGATCANAASARGKGQNRGRKRRGDLFEKPRRLMNKWPKFCSLPGTRGKVVSLHEESAA